MLGVKDRFILRAEESILVVIDVQEKLCKAMDEGVLRKLLDNTGLLLEAANTLAIPVVVTEQYPRGLGPTLLELKAKVSTPVLEKLTFSCCGIETFTQVLNNSERKQVILVGMETHVCVLQTAIDLLDAGFTVHLVQDALMSRTKQNWRIGLEAARNAGAVITSAEAALFQLLKVAGTEDFKKLSKLVR